MGKRSSLWIALGLAGCSTPSFNTDLNPEGPPVVTSVFVSSESAGGDAPTYCSGEDGVKKPSSCEGEVSAVGDAIPVGWQVRIVFDELLDASIETIADDGSVSISAANPVTLTCGDETVAYDGYYDPSGNHISSPPGPALVIVPSTAPAAMTGASCSVSVNSSVVDKDGEAASGTGPFSFVIASLGVGQTVPEDGAVEVDPATVVQVKLNSYIDLTAADGLVTLTAGADDVAITVSLVEGDDSTFAITPSSGSLADNTEYTLTVYSGVADVLGGELAEDFSFSFTTSGGASVDGGADIDADLSPDAGVDADITPDAAPAVDA